MSEPAARTLVTGFLGFEGFPVNPSALLAESCGRRFELIEVSYAAVDTFLESLDANTFDRLILLGVAAGSKRLRLESSARNIVGPRPDARGFAPPAGPIIAGAPQALKSAIWPDVLLTETTSRRPSDDAGEYLCNYVYFRALCRFPHKAVGFMHVPPLDQMDLGQQRAALGEILDAVESAAPSDSIIAIRTVRESDLPAFRELRLDALRSHPEAFGADHEEGARQPEQHWLDRIRAGTGDGDGLTCVAETRDGALVGMTGVRRETGVKVRHGALIWGVYVRPDWRGHGLGSRLLATCLDWATARGVRRVDLAVETSNAAAIRCYERLGFDTYGVLTEMIRVGNRYYDERLMTRKLPPAHLPRVMDGLATCETGPAQEASM